jgi:hypothetical protein
VRVSLGLGPIGAGTQCAQSLVPAPIPTAGQPHKPRDLPVPAPQNQTPDRRRDARGRGESLRFFLDRFCLVSMLRAKRNRPLTLGKKGITFVYWAIFGFSIQDSSPGAHIRNTILTGNTWQTAWRLGATVRTRRLHVLAPNVRDNERSVQYRTMHACIHKGGSAEHVVQTEENNADRGSTKAQP